MELDDATHKKIQALSAEGDALAEKGNYPAALEKYWTAFDLVPEPKTDWEATTWLLAAIGDSNFMGKDFKAGVDNLTMAMHCPGAIGNPFLHLRLGQCQFETGNMEKAADELTRCYAIAGEDIFENDEPKYFLFLNTKINTEPPKKKPWWKL